MSGRLERISISIVTSLVLVVASCAHHPAPEPAPNNTAPPVAAAGADRACLAGTWTQGPVPGTPPSPGACGTCPPTTYELTAPTAVGFAVEERGVVRRQGAVTFAADAVVFELDDDAGAAARFSCVIEGACDRLRCTWSLGGAGESMLTR